MISTKDNAITFLMFSFHERKVASLCEGDKRLTRSLLSSLNPTGDLNTVNDAILRDMEIESNVLADTPKYDWGAYTIFPQLITDGPSLIIRKR